jgi:hypothetical protein
VDCKDAADAEASYLPFSFHKSNHQGQFLILFHNTSLQSCRTAVIGLIGVGCAQVSVQRRNLVCNSTAQPLQEQQPVGSLNTGRDLPNPLIG